MGETKIHEQKPYFSVTGETVRAIEEEQAKSEAWDMLKDGEMWKLAVQEGNTEMGLDDWCNYVLDTDGYEGLFDIDYKLGNAEVKGKTYVFDFQSGGQHVVDPTLIRHYFVPAGVHASINDLWDTYHLRNIDTISDLSTMEAIKRIGESQDVEAIKKDFIARVTK